MELAVEMPDATRCFITRWTLRKPTGYSRRGFLSPELQRLVEALHRLRHCEPRDEHRLASNYRRLFLDAASRLPSGQSEADLQRAIQVRARQMEAAEKKRFPTIPPKA